MVFLHLLLLAHPLSRSIRFPSSFFLSTESLPKTCLYPHGCHRIIIEETVQQGVDGMSWWKQGTSTMTTIAINHCQYPTLYEGWFSHAPYHSGKIWVWIPTVSVECLYESAVSLAINEMGNGWSREWRGAMERTESGRREVKEDADKKKEACINISRTGR